MRVLVLLVSLFSMACTADSILEEQRRNLENYYFSAARIGDIELIDKFFDVGMGVDRQNEKGYSALMIAAYNGQKVMVRHLIERGANACAEDHRGNTALMAAIFKGEFFIAKDLMSVDCDPNHQNNAGQTPLMYAALFDRKQLVEALTRRGADIQLTDNQGYNAADIAASQGNKPLSDKLKL